MGDKEFKERTLERFQVFENARASMKSLMLQNIEGRRQYLQTLLLIIFVAATFAISIENDIGTASLVIGVSSYLICAISICIYMPYLLTKDGNSMELQLGYIATEESALYKAIESGEINSEETLESFRAKRHKDELKFRENNFKKVPDQYFGLSTCCLFSQQSSY